MAKPVDLLRRRVNYFLEANYRHQGEVRQFISGAQAYGEVGIIGGMLRDLWLIGSRQFVSDIDFVIDAADPEKFASFMRSQGAEPNNFGGFKLKLARWSVDAWVLSQTWAKQAGHCRVSSLQDLIHTTFFDWDAIIYRVSDRKIWCHYDYFDRLAGRLLDVNLEPNPNVTGAVVRSLRFITRRGAQIGPRLIAYLARNLPKISNGEIITTEWKAYRTKYLTPEFLLDARSKIFAQAQESPLQPLKISPEPLALWPHLEAAQSVGETDSH